MHHRDTIDEDGYIVTVLASATGWGILMDDLQVVLMDGTFVNQFDVLIVPIFTREGELSGAVIVQQFGDIFECRFLVGDMGIEEEVPLIISELDIIELLQLVSEVGDEFLFCIRVQTLISLVFELFKERLLQLRLALISDALGGVVLENRNHR